MTFASSLVTSVFWVPAFGRDPEYGSVPCFYPPVKALEQRVEAMGCGPGKGPGGAGNGHGAAGHNPAGGGGTRLAQDAVPPEITSVGLCTVKEGTIAMAT